MGFSWAFINPAADNPPDLSVTTSGLAATASLAAQSLTASVVGGTSPYVYAWTAIQPDGSDSTSEFSTTSGSTTLFTPAATGLYSVTCTVTDSSTTTLTASSAQSKVIGTDLSASFVGLASTSSVAAQALTASVAGGSETYSFSWSVVRPDNSVSTSEFSSTTAQSCSFTVAQKGLNVVRVKVTDSAAAIVTATSSAEIGTTAGDLNVTVSGLAATSSLAPQALSSSVEGGLIPYNFSWSSVRPDGTTSTSEFNSTTSATPTFSPQRVGLYTVICTVTDTPDIGTGLTASGTQSKFLGVELSASISGLSSTQSTNAQPITASVFGGTGSYSYEWSVVRPNTTSSTSEFSGGESNASASVLFTLGYAGHNVVRCKVTDASSESFIATASAEIGITGSDLSITSTGLAASVNLDAQQLTASVLGGIEPYSFSFSATRPDGTVSTSEFDKPTGSLTTLFTPARVGLHSVTCTVTDSSTPVLTASSTQAKPVGTILSVSITGLVSTSSMAAQAVTASVVGGTGSPTFYWTNADSESTGSITEFGGTTSGSAFFTPAFVGLNSVAVKVTDSSGATAETTSSVSLGVTGSDFTVIAAGLAATSSLAPQNLTATPALGLAPYSFSWTAIRPDGSSSTAEFNDATTQNPVFSPLRVGLYSVKCTATDAATPALTASSTQAKFIGEVLTTTITGLTSTSSMAAQDLTASTTGGSGSYTFTWSNRNGVAALSTAEFSNFSTSPLSQSVTFTPAIGGLNVVSVRVTDQAGGLDVATASAELGVTGSDLSLTTAGLAATASLAEQNLTSTPAGGATPYTFSWTATGPSGSVTTDEFDDATTQNPKFRPLAVGLYTVTCTVTDSSVPALTASSAQAKFIGEDLVATITGLTTTASVAAQQVTASVTGGTGSYSFTWSAVKADGVATSAGFSTFSETPLSQSAIYSASIQGLNVVRVRVEDQASNIFTATASAFIGVTSSGGSGDMALTTTGLSARGDFNTQGLTASVVGGTAPLSFSWSTTRPDGSTTTSEYNNAATQNPTFTPAVVGLHTVTCTVTDNATPALTASHSQAKFLGTALAGAITGSALLDLATPSSSADISPQFVTASLTGAGAGSETYSWSAIQPGDPNPTTTLYSNFSTSPLSQSATFTPTKKGIHTLLCTVTDAQSTSILLTKTIDVGTDLIKAGEMKTILVTDEWDVLQGYQSTTGADQFTGSIENSTNNVGGSDHGKTVFKMITSPGGDCKRPDHWIFRQSPPITEFGSQFTDFRAGGILTLQMENTETEAHDTDSEALFGFGLVSNNYSSSLPATTAIEHFIATGTGSAGRGSGANINGTISNLNNTDFVYIGFSYVAAASYAKSVHDINNQSDAFNTNTNMNPAEGASAFGIVRILSGGIPDSNSGYGIRADGVDGAPSTISNNQVQFSGENSGDDMRFIAFIGADKDGTATFPITASFKMKVGFTPYSFPPQ